jgi:hypothetical protein
MKLLMTSIMLTFSFTAFANNYTANALYAIANNCEKIELVLKQLGAVYGDQAKMKKLIQQRDATAQELKQVFKRYGLEMPNGDFKYNIKGNSLGQVCGNAIAGQIQNIKNVEYFKYKVDDYKVRQLLNKMEKLSKEEYIPILRDCESRDI